MSSERPEEVYAVIFKSIKVMPLSDDYTEMKVHLMDLAKQQPGFIGKETFTAPDGRSLSISYWRSLDAIERWKHNSEHMIAKSKRDSFYKTYKIEVCKLLSSYAGPL
jgi:heme-degrading monooxygenase HmoA